MAEAYKHYGGRGIKVDSMWKSSYFNFELWASNTYIYGLTIERVNNSLGYSPGNCIWADSKAQANNRRLTKKSVGSSRKNIKIAAAESIKQNHYRYGNPRSRGYKICCSCRLKKELDKFQLCKINLDGRQKYCRLCRHNAHVIERFHARYA